MNSIDITIPSTALAPTTQVPSIINPQTSSQRFPSIPAFATGRNAAQTPSEVRSRQRIQAQTRTGLATRTPEGDPIGFSLPTRSNDNNSPLVPTLSKDRYCNNPNKFPY